MLTVERLEEIKERRQQGAPDNPIGNANYVEMVDFVFYALADRHSLITEVERLRAALEKIAYTPAFKSQAEVEVYATQVLEGAQ